MSGAGRPLKYPTPEALDEAINAYFKSCYDDEGKLVKPITYTGLAVAIGTNRQTLLNYSHKDQFVDSLTRAKAICEEYAESQLFIGRNPSGAQFALSSNYEGWASKQSVDHTSKGESINPAVSRLSEIAAKLNVQDS